MTVVPDKFRGTREYALVYSDLLTAARYRGTVTYQEVAFIMGFPSWNLGVLSDVAQLLNEICEDEHRRDRPMLGAVVVNASSLTPGAGFYKIARDFGKLTEEGSEAEGQFWQKECQAAYDTWKRDLSRPKPR